MRIDRKLRRRGYTFIYWFVATTSDRTYFVRSPRMLCIPMHEPLFSLVDKIYSLVVVQNELECRRTHRIGRLRIDQLFNCCSQSMSGRRPEPPTTGS